MNGAAELERFLHEQIPLTVAMGVRVAECDDSHSCSRRRSRPIATICTPPLAEACTRWPP